jgi:hypothetical protein
MQIIDTVFAKNYIRGPSMVKISDSKMVFFLPRESESPPPMKAPIVAPKTAVLTTF